MGRIVSANNRFLLIIIGAAIALLVGFRVLAGFLVDWSWFSSLGLAEVFWTRVLARIALFTAVFAVSAALLIVNGILAQRRAGPRRMLRPVASPWNSIEGLNPPAALEQLYRNFPWGPAVIVAGAGLGFLIALSSFGVWDLVLRYLHQVPYGEKDPLFGLDIGFFLFSLPVYEALKDWLLFILVVSGIFAAALYWVHGAIIVDQQRRYVAPAAAAHISVIAGLYLVAKAADFWLQRFGLVYGDNGVVVGASYTDVHLQMPLFWIMACLSLVAALVCFANVRGQSLKLPLFACFGLVVFSIVIAPLAAGVFERFVVKPSQLQLEAPYIARNIAMTREAYDLNRIEVKPFEGDDALSYASLKNNSATIDNIRLWDYKPLLSSYGQLQEIRTYYKFHDADVDRYWLDGRYQQVMTSARELKSDLLPSNVQTWLNLHVIFTHGNGVAMSPVTKATEGGLPALYVQDIPPISNGGPKITEPRIYFGEELESYVIVKSSTPEFDYPKGDQNVYAAYTGKDGVKIGGLANRALYSWYFGDINILLSSYVTPESRIVFHRNIASRVKKIAPFLRLDKDPYIVVSDGKLFWIQDAYTVSSAFPYSKRMEDGTANYIRNSVKVVVDAYNGTVDFYIADAGDPLIKTYARIYPGLFRPIAAMPADLRQHVRYPEDFFTVQADMYRAYHMQTPEVFYNREDLWQFPKRPASDEGDAEGRMAPYYLNMRLPGEKETEFVLMLPMAPNQRDNMIAWLAARCDGPSYGKLVVYTFPKDKLVYGPFQINALISQNTEVSQQISLWNQMGSRVIHGNLLVVPIDDSLLYVMPLYLRAASGQLPELKRVIAVYNGKVVMDESLAKVLATLFPAPNGAAADAAAAAAGAQNPLPALKDAAQGKGPASDAARAALDHYNKALAKLKAGDWAGFGAELNAMKPLLEEMNAGKK
nr:UPF0182 family protein [Rhizomicrobium palustre]